MKKSLTIAIITIILIIFTLPAMGCAIKIMKKKDYENLQLQQFRIETSGDMTGGRSCLTVHFDEENNCTAVYNSKSSWWYLDPSAECYATDKSLLDEIKQIIIDEKLYNAPKSPQSHIQVMDAASTTYSIQFSEGEYFSYSTNQRLHKSVNNAHKEIIKLINEYCKNGTSYPTVCAMNEDTYVDWRETEGITLQASNEAAFTITLKVYNNLFNDESEAAVLTGNVVLSKLDGDKAASEEVLIEDLTMNILNGDSKEVSKKFTIDNYPAEGTYKIEYAGYETTFEMKVYKVTN